ncbi:MAG: gliding motility-associated ABC transporter permease subunit GldF [Bacteroidales bacterium]|nr:gliding motility-associated ABC transporter permease subunit GldF [Bacteroidales bacterium]
MWYLFWKEVKSFLFSLIGYIVIIVFLVSTSLLLWLFQGSFNILNYGYATLEGFFLLTPFVFLFLIPAISMKMFSDEFSYGTIELLLTKPISEAKIVIAKFLAGLLILLIALLPTLVYYASLYYLAFPVGNIDIGGINGSYVGLFLMGASFLSIGMFASSLTKNHLVAFVLGLFFSTFMYLGFEFIYDIGIFGKGELFIKSLGIEEHYKSLSRGVVDSRDVVYFLSVIFFFLFLSWLNLKNKK